MSEKLIRNVSEIGVDGVVLPATRPDRVKHLSELLDLETYIISPGIRAQGAAPGDAIVNGSDYEVVGRAIYQSDDPKSEAERMYQEVLGRLEGQGESERSGGDRK